MNTQAQLATPLNTSLESDTGFIDGLPNADYHNPAYGISATGIKTMLDDPAEFVWSMRATKDASKLQAIDFGTDFHLYFLEPDVFAETHQVLPTYNRRKPDEKQAELDKIEEWKAKGIKAVSAEDMQKLAAMRESALAHPTVSAIMGMNGIPERSFFWKDKTTGVNCKCRPDYLVPDLTDKTRPAFISPEYDHLVADVKTVGQFDRIQNQIENLKYYVQDAFYTQGIEQVLGGKVCFMFAFVSTTLSIGRYPVTVIQLDDTAKLDGRNEVAEALRKYKNLGTDFTSENWQTVQVMDRPHWAMNEEAL